MMNPCETLGFKDLDPQQRAAALELLRDKDLET